jgi:aspartate/methionine/tyrosine aminotransferase
MKEAVVELIARRGGPPYDPYGEVVIPDGDGSAILNSLLVLTDPGDEVILTDPTYAGMLHRVRLIGAEPKLVPLRGDAAGSTRLTSGRPRRAGRLSARGRWPIQPA